MFTGLLLICCMLEGLECYYSIFYYLQRCWFRVTVSYFNSTPYPLCENIPRSLYDVLFEDYDYSASPFVFYIFCYVIRSALQGLTISILSLFSLNALQPIENAFRYDDILSTLRINLGVFLLQQSLSL